MDPPTRGWHPVGNCFFPDSARVHAEGGSFSTKLESQDLQVCSGLWATSLHTDAACLDYLVQVGQAGGWGGR